ncbi:PREDICTED: alpha/beta hydrolase domain-containing protein 17A, partial [Tinamus guttatus]|uniref:alpha/beta hydrolase domain-containing protein 17A n=1 Tax=Tinamus guttatus TaxID=94827 RepID=UPI00052E8A2D
CDGPVKRKDLDVVGLWSAVKLLKFLGGLGDLALVPDPVTLGLSQPPSGGRGVAGGPLGAPSATFSSPKSLCSQAQGSSHLLEPPDPILRCSRSRKRLLHGNVLCPARGGRGHHTGARGRRGSAQCRVAARRFTVLFSHGNAVDLGQMSSFYIGLGTRINCNIFSYDYSGYGVSTGKPSEKNLYSDIDAAWQALRTRYGISPENIILYGQSIGTVPTVDLASRYECAAIVLHSPLTSGMRVAFPETKKTYCFDAFPNIEKISKITSPVLIIHGTEDEVIDFSHGLALFERRREPLWVDGAGHNDIELYSQYLERLRKFISQELASQRT